MKYAISLTKAYQARPANPPRSQKSGETAYEISPDAEAILRHMPPEAPDPHSYGTRGGSKYLTDAGSAFNLEINLLDTASKLPIRGTQISIDDRKAFTDRVGRAVFRLPFGLNKVQVTGSGYVEAGAFAPRPVQFEPLLIEVDMDSDSIFTLYSTGEIVPGERRVVGATAQGIDFEGFIRENWKILTLAGGGILGVYMIGKKQKD